MASRALRVRSKRILDRWGSGRPSNDRNSLYADACVMVCSFIPAGLDSRGTERSMSSGVGLAAPSAANASAHSFPWSLLCPLIHLKLVGADLHHMAYTAALNQDAFGTPVHPASSQLCRELVIVVITYCELVIMVRSAFRGTDCKATTTAAISSAWLDWSRPGTWIALFSGCPSAIHTPPPDRALFEPFCRHEPSVYTVSWVGGGAISCLLCMGVGFFCFGSMKILKQLDREWAVTVGLNMTLSPRCMTAR